MKKLAVLALCFFSSFANATDVEEIVVTARRIEILFIKISQNHIQDPKTGEWHYVAPAAAPAKKEESDKGKA